MRTKRWKNAMRWMLSASLCMSVVVSGIAFPQTKTVEAAESVTEVKVEKGSKVKYVVGEMFLPVSVAPESAEHLIDNSGMSGIEAPNHMHACFDSSDAESNTLSEKCQYLGDMTPVVIDLGIKQSLGQMFIWNYNDIQHLEMGMKEVKIEYSEDGVVYNDMGVHILSQCSKTDNEEYYGNVASTIDNQGSFNFGGVTGRYIKITPVSNYGGDKYGLAEIRIFRHKTEPYTGQNITVDAFTPNQLENTNITNAFNYSGMNGIDSCYPDDEKHSNNPEDMCIINGDSNEALMVINLDGNYPIHSIKLWNYNDPENLDIGLKDFEIWYTTDSPCKIVTYEKEGVESGQQDWIDFGQGDWTKLGDYTLPKADGNVSKSYDLKIDLDGKHVQHIKIVPKTNHKGETSNFGLSEVKIYADKGWATEYSREWTGMVSSSGEFAYQGNAKANTKGASLTWKDNGRGWIGGDGIHGTSLNGEQAIGSVNGNSKTIFTFQDSFEGNFGNYETFTTEYGYGGTGNDGNTGFNIGMRNMAYLMLNGDEPDPRNMQYYMTLNNGLSDSHTGGNILPNRYWIGDSTVVNNNLYSIANQYSGLDVNDADFFETPLSDNGFPDMNQDTTNYLKLSGIETNGGVYYHENLLELGKWIYMYGRGLEENGISDRMVVSRIKKEDYPSMDAGKITYWNGSAWVDDYKAAAAITDFNPGNEWNITYMEDGPFPGKYILINTALSVSGSTQFALADSPEGPFEKPEEHKLYFATEKYKLWMRYYQNSKTVFQQWNYNAKAQPAISKDGELLFSYHFGVHDDRTVFKDGSYQGLMPAWGYFNSTCKEYEHPTFVKIFDVADRITESEAENLALRLTTTVSASSEDVDGNRLVEKVRDGNVVSEDSRWSSYASGINVDEAWVAYDLQQQADLEKVKLYWEDAYGIQYEIQVKSDENEDWRTVATQTNGSGGVEEIPLNNAENVRYIRLVGSECASLAFGKFGYSLYEFEVNGQFRTEQTIEVTTENVRTLGKTFVEDGVVTFSYANAGMEIRFNGTSIKANFVSDTNQRIAVFVDDMIEPDDAKIIELAEGTDIEVTLAENLPDGDHTITIRKMDRGYHGFLEANAVGVKSITLNIDDTLLPKSTEKKMIIEAYGDSITNGDALYDLGDGTSAAYSWKGYIGELARMYDADIKSCGISGNGLLRSILKDDNGQYYNLFAPQNNWSVIDESAGPAANVVYDHSANPADVVIINLGTNDNAAFTAEQITTDEFKTEYLRFIQEIHADCPDAIVIGCLGAMGADGLFAPIREAIDAANADAGYTYAYFVELTNCAEIDNGRGLDHSHPSAVAGEIYAQQIAEVIDEAMKTPEGDQITPGGNENTPGGATSGGNQNTPGGATSGGNQNTPGGATSGENITSLDGSTMDNTLSVENSIQTITTNKTDKDIKDSVFAELSLRVTKSTKTSNKLKWNKVKDAEGYIIFTNKCGKPLKVATTIKKAGTTSWTHKKLKKGTYYKYLVIAYKNVDGKSVTVSTSKTIHVPTTGGKTTDIKALKANKKTVTLKKNKTFTLKVTEAKKNNRLKIKHHKKISYESTNTKVATVNKNGKIKAKAKGKCYIYAYAQNGVFKKIKVIVK